MRASPVDGGRAIAHDSDMRISLPGPPGLISLPCRPALSSLHGPPGLTLMLVLAACGDPEGGRGETSDTAPVTTVVPGATTSASTTTATSTGEPTTAGDDTTTDLPPTTDAPSTSTTGEPATSTSTGPDPGSESSTAPLGDTGSTTLPDTTTGEPECITKIDAVVRDFRISHPDFEDFGGAVDGLVKPELGADNKPIHAADGPTSVTSGPENFNQWYNDVPGVNQTFALQLDLTEVMPGIYQYKNSTFFPIDNKGFGNEGNSHNYHFTTEIHTEFVYFGGEQFTFTGDDDLWMFINNKLAIDLGGVHGELSETIDLDASAAQLGIVKGAAYKMDIFHAERHTSKSNFRIDTTIGCFIVPG